MSAEVEEQVKEEQVKEGKKPLIKLHKSLRSRLELGLLIVKILELLLCIICMSLVYEPLVINSLGRGISINHVGIMYTAITGYMVINGVILVSRIIGDTIPYRTLSIFAVMGSALFLTTGILLAVDRPMLEKHVYAPPLSHLLVLLTIGIIFIFINFILLAADAIVSFVMHVS